MVEYESMFVHLARTLSDPWATTARPEQLPPPGDWTTWLYCAGRGSGKTRAGAEWIRKQAEAATAPRIALVGPTAADVLDAGLVGVVAIGEATPDPINYSAG